MSVKELSVILVESGADTRAVSEYFSFKRQLKLGSSVPPAVCSKRSVQVLQNRLHSAIEAKLKNVVPLVVLCLDEFASNEQNEGTWTSVSEEVTFLLVRCIEYLSANKDSNTIRVLRRFCNVLVKLCLQSTPMSTLIFNKCAKDLLNVVFRKDLGSDVRSIILDTVEVSCQHSEFTLIYPTFRLLGVHLRYLAKMVRSLHVDDQAVVYGILRKSLRNIDEAQLKAIQWFPKHLKLQQAFFDGYSLPISKGSGMFINTLFKMDHCTEQERMQNVWGSSLESAGNEVPPIFCTSNKPVVREQDADQQLTTSLQRGNWQLSNSFCTGQVLEKSDSQIPLGGKVQGASGLGKRKEILTDGCHAFKMKLQTHNQAPTKSSKGNGNALQKTQLTSASEDEKIKELYRKTMLKRKSPFVISCKSLSLKSQFNSQSQEIRNLKTFKETGPKTIAAGPEVNKLIKPKEQAVEMDTNVTTKSSSEGRPISSKCLSERPGSSLVQNDEPQETSDDQLRELFWKNVSGWKRLSLNNQVHDFSKAPSKPKTLVPSGPKTNVVESESTKHKSHMQLLNRDLSRSIANSETSYFNPAEKDKSITDVKCDKAHGQTIVDHLYSQKTDRKIDTTWEERRDKIRRKMRKTPKDTEKDFENIKNWLEKCDSCDVKSDKQENTIASDTFPQATPLQMTSYSKSKQKCDNTKRIKQSSNIEITDKAPREASGLLKPSAKIEKKLNVQDHPEIIHLDSFPHQPKAVNDRCFAKKIKSEEPNGLPASKQRTGSWMPPEMQQSSEHLIWKTPSDVHNKMRSAGAKKKNAEQGHQSTTRNVSESSASKLGADQDVNSFSDLVQGINVSRRNQKLQARENYKAPSNYKTQSSIMPLHSFLGKENVIVPNYKLVGQDHQKADDKDSSLSRNINMVSEVIALSETQSSAICQGKKMLSELSTQMITSDQITDKPSESVSMFSDDPFDSCARTRKRAFQQSSPNIQKPPLKKLELPKCNSLRNSDLNNLPGGYWKGKVQGLVKSMPVKLRTKDVYDLEDSSVVDVKIFSDPKPKKSAKHRKTSSNVNLTKLCAPPPAVQKEVKQNFVVLSPPRANYHHPKQAKSSFKKYNFQKESTHVNGEPSEIELQNKTPFLSKKSPADIMFDNLLLSSPGNGAFNSVQLQHPVTKSVVLLPKDLKVNQKIKAQKACDVKDFYFHSKKKDLSNSVQLHENLPVKEVTSDYGLSDICKPCVYSPLLDDSLPIAEQTITNGTSDVDSGLEATVQSADFKSHPSVSNFVIPQPYCVASYIKKDETSCVKMPVQICEKCATPSACLEPSVMSASRTHLLNAVCLNKSVLKSTPSVKEKMRNIKDLAAQISLAVQSCDENCDIDLEKLEAVDNELKKGIRLLDPEEDETFEPSLSASSGTYDEQYLKYILDSYRNPKSHSFHKSSGV